MINDELLFAPENLESTILFARGDDWILVIVDDDQEVHSITRLVLKDFSLDGRGLKMISAYSAAEAKKVLLANPDCAVILLDVVMETEDAGLELVKWIRDDWENAMVRIILRTGQPGAAPEKKVISEYRINDYKAKTELTELKLFTAVTVAIRSFQDLKMIKRSESGFKRIVEASGELFRNRSKANFYSGVLMQLTSLLRLDESSLFLHSDGMALEKSGTNLVVLAATGKFEKYHLGEVFADGAPELMKLIQQVLPRREGIFSEKYFVGYYRGDEGGESVIIFFSSVGFQPLDREMILVFSSNIAMAFENIDLSNQIESTQRELIFTLGELVESRSQETGNHVRRVGDLAALVGELYGLPTNEVETLRLAAPMHDVGKIGIPDHILHKPSALTPEELVIMRKHTIIGQEILKGGSGVLSLAASIARSHHERWDGRGYPDGLKGEEIPLVARITGLCDVFDALLHERNYKSAWTMQDTLIYMKENRGTHFDPKILDLFLENLSGIMEIIHNYQD